MSLTELVDHIEKTHHAYLHEELPRLAGMTRKVVATHVQYDVWERGALQRRLPRGRHPHAMDPNVEYESWQVDDHRS